MNGIENSTSYVVLPLCNLSSKLENIYELLYAIRIFEQSLLELFDNGVLTGTTHTCLGQEATAVGVISAVDREKDIIFSNHRGHGHFLAYCGEIERLYLELMGKPSGVCAGRGGSQHLHYKNFYSNGIQGGIVPVATGMALAEKMKGTDAISIVFLGDGTLGEGVVYESFNIASLWGLPILFVIDENGYAQSTPTDMQVAGSIRKRAEAFGIPVAEHRVMNVREVLSIAGELIGKVRKNSRPHCLVLHSNRLGPHSRGDDFRDMTEIQKAWELDPLKFTMAELKNGEESQIQEKINAMVSLAKEQALKAASYDV